MFPQILNFVHVPDFDVTINLTTNLNTRMLSATLLLLAKEAWQ
jgi:hypothetical protein